MTQISAELEAPLRRIHEALEALQVSDTMKAMVSKEAEGTRFTADLLYREWVNDVLGRPADHPVRTESLAKPDVHYFRYAERRVEEPQMPSPRLVRRLMDEYGVEIVAPVREFIWQRQINWAKRLQRHPNDDVVVLAKYFLMDATGNDCDTAFEGLVRYQQEQYQPDTYEDLRKFDEDDAALYSIPVEDLEIFPACIDYTRWKRGEKHASMPDHAKAQIAAGIRKQYQLAQQAEQISSLKRWYTDHPMYRNDMIMPEAAKVGLQSDDILLIHSEFLLSFEKEGVPAGNETPELRFMSMMQQYVRDGRSLPDLSAEETARRRSEIACLFSSWHRKLTDSHLTLQGGDPAVFKQWQTLSLNGERRVPDDWLLDYYLFLFSRLAA